MKILALTTGPSAVDYFQNYERYGPLQDDIVVLGLHKVVPYVFTNKNPGFNYGQYTELRKASFYNTDIKVDYWTWGDPNAVVDGLLYYRHMKDSGDEEGFDRLPTIIVPRYMSTVSYMLSNGGSSAISGKPVWKDIYNEVMSEMEELGKIHYLEHAQGTRTLNNDAIFEDPALRFNGDKVYFGSVKFDGAGSHSNWAHENKLTVNIYPIAHYLGATEVYALGFDNRGTGIGRPIPFAHNNQTTIDKYLKKYDLWTSWEKYHGMKLYSCIRDEYSDLNKKLPFVPLTELCK